MTPGQLAQETGLSTGATTALLDRLERGGFVWRKRDLSDRRRVLVQPTKRPIDEVWPIFEELVAGAAELMGQFGFKSSKPFCVS
jgi:DNA-binding MarR family transcriptional regulator